MEAMSELTERVLNSGELALLRMESEKEDLSNAALCGWASIKLENLCHTIDGLEITLEEVRKAAREWEKAAQASSKALGDYVIQQMRRNPEGFLPPKAKP
jgi:hypothetical protein